MTRIPPHYRWWLALAGLIALYLLGKHVYFTLLPAEGWIDRGWYAMRAYNYPLAEKCFKRAETKAPDADLPKIALWALYQSMTYGEWASRYELFVRLPFIGSYIESRVGSIHDEQREYAESALAKYDDWGYARFSRFPALDVFTELWKGCPREMPVVFDAVALTQEGRVREGWEKFHQLEITHPQSFRLLCDTEPYCVIYYCEAAWRTGHHDEAHRILRSSAGNNAMKKEEMYRQQNLPNIYMAQSLTVNTASVWHTLDQHKRPVSSLEAPDGTVSGVVLVPAHDGAQLLYIDPWKSYTDKPLIWWQWRGKEWQMSPQGETEKLQRVVIRPLNVIAPPPGVNPLELLVHAAWSDTAEYLALCGDMFGHYTAALMRIDGGVRQLSGISPKEIVMCGDDLWVRGDVEFMRVKADGTVISYQGKTVTRLARIFETAERLPPLPVALDQQWQPATDGGGRLWLVSWDRKTVIPRVVWENGAFRKATAQEVSAAKEGFVDSANRLWLTANLPKGFKRDAWRDVPGFPRIADIATYAVDRKGRVWMICGGIAARWEGGHWASVAQYLPIFATFQNIIAVDDGVMILAGDRVCYLE